ncbi:hypothetical protein K461DRAFT_277511 [Myriangium duriaei CBS 260.36]|uniref:Secreted protein n=1 Tax=Myriangium duriaei CBS 260.36 TaxID=1168546 RepID=A0A9P4J2R4_9PEZI|nr:hypothetical protein K461DRAFT_277511 [Myriangium duriaei CBS 260.36]
MPEKTPLWVTLPLLPWLRWLGGPAIRLPAPTHHLPFLVQTQPPLGVQRPDPNLNHGSGALGSLSSATFTPFPLCSPYILALRHTVVGQHPQC